MTRNPERRSVRIDIAVCTYRRAELDQTLLSLAVLTVPVGVTVRIIVADNDVTPSARHRVEAMRSAVPFEIAYVHCPASNISIARNACLEHATGDFVAFIDDDETASEDWLAELLVTADTTGADAVLGPVSAVYPNVAPGWMRRGDFHSTLPVWVSGDIRTGYTCNALLRRNAPSLAGRRFNIALGRSGGEDTEFFAHMHRAGGKIAFAEDAMVYEPVPSGRATVAWLTKRRFRMGQTHGRMLLETSAGLRRWKAIALAGAKSGYCFAAAALLAAFPVQRHRYGLRGIMHAGVVSGLFGVREIEQYGSLEKAPQ
ncbi:glycosyltransferase family 2 protein (plasmid) [Rhizobium sp. CB3171]|uniref:glycosyltransferase n=1 Tax=Rhizobium sp. CB3171 TaxID=3039157 RepID=UPI0024B13175|nr:glycosyltransferase family 2 protein [Rhizobium sp. CB3171]WFU06450.1 glycosyltransferase family 2 protein [Rhizobium sp. CB3171]